MDKYSPHFQTWVTRFSARQQAAPKKRKAGDVFWSDDSYRAARQAELQQPDAWHEQLNGSIDAFDQIARRQGGQGGQGTFQLFNKKSK